MSNVEVTSSINLFPDAGADGDGPGFDCPRYLELRNEPNEKRPNLARRSPADARTKSWPNCFTPLGSNWSSRCELAKLGFGDPGVP